MSAAPSALTLSPCPEGVLESAFADQTATDWLHSRSYDLFLQPMAFMFCFLWQFLIDPWELS
jgi:hypothetical protein